MQVSQIASSFAELNQQINSLVAVQQQQWNDQSNQINAQIEDFENDVKKTSGEVVDNFITTVQAFTGTKSNDVTWDDSEPWVDEPWDDEIDLDDEAAPAFEPEVPMMVPEQADDVKYFVSELPTSPDDLY